MASALAAVLWLAPLPGAAQTGRGPAAPAPAATSGAPAPAAAPGAPAPAASATPGAPASGSDGVRVDPPAPSGDATVPAAPTAGSPLPPVTPEEPPVAAELPPPAPHALPPGYYGRYEPDAGSYPEANPAGYGFHEHEGFYLRLSIGVGATVVGYRESVDGAYVSDVKTRGLSALFGVSVGGRVVENLIIHGDLQVTAYGTGEREIDGTADARDRIDGSLSLLGGGVTYYFSETNAYLTGIMGVSRFTEQRDGEDAVESDLGFGVSTLVGKEWWVGRRGQWGVGGALRASFYTARVDIARVESQLAAFDIGLVFGTTFN